ncbi:T9SS type A sorting domain-containing protein, partial [Arthrospira platensis SPKY1]|nr:T9SS type A sorting domain-containing protein [Arthrospira platensis SPKY1]
SFELVEDNRQSEKVVRVRSNYDAQADLAVFSAKGQKVIARREVIRKGENMVKLDLSGLAAGVYVVHFTTSAGKEWTQRIVKL